MQKGILSVLFASLISFAFSQNNECTGKMYPPPAFSDSVRKYFEAHLRSAEKKYRNDSTDDDYIIWYGRRLAYLGRYKEAIDIYSKGIKLHPGNARYYRHRGHRFITLRCFDQAIDDLKKGTELVKGQIDEIEADGIPNEMNIPVSTLHTNLYYHLGLAYYLVGDYRQALLTYEKCLEICDNDDMKVAALNWLNLILRKMGRNKEADQHLKIVHDDMEIIENFDYFDILMMYKTGDVSKLSEKTGVQESLSNATLGYGLGMYYLFNGEKKKANDLFSKVVAGNQWSSFGFIAAEAELRK